MKSAGYFTKMVKSPNQLIIPQLGDEQITRLSYI